MKDDVYLYPDGIYIKEKFNNYSYLKRIVKIDLNNYPDLLSALQKGSPLDKFETELDNKNYTEYHKVPWSEIAELMGISYGILNVERKKLKNTSNKNLTLYTFLFQKLSKESEIKDENGDLSNKDKFQIAIPEQTLNNVDKSLIQINKDEELNKYLTNDEYLYVGQFIFMNPYDENKPEINATFAKRDVPQHVYVFNNFGDNFNFRNNFVSAETLPDFSNNNSELVQKPLNVNEVYKYLSLPVTEQKPDVGINPDFNASDIVNEPIYEFIKQSIDIQKVYNFIDTSNINNYLKNILVSNQDVNNISDILVNDNTNNQKNYKKEVKNDVEKVNTTNNQNIPKEVKIDVEKVNTTNNSNNNVASTPAIKEYVDQNRDVIKDDLPEAFGGSQLSNVNDDNINNGSQVSSNNSNNNNVNSSLIKDKNGMLMDITDDDLSKELNNVSSNISGNNDDGILKEIGDKPAQRRPSNNNTQGKLLDGETPIYVPGTNSEINKANENVVKEDIIAQKNSALNKANEQNATMEALKKLGINNKV